MREDWDHFVVWRSFKSFPRGNLTRTSRIHTMFLNFKLTSKVWNLKLSWSVQTGSWLKGKFPQTTMWIGWEESHFRNASVDVWADLANPLKRSDLMQSCAHYTTLWMELCQNMLWSQEWQLVRVHGRRAWTCAPFCWEHQEAAKLVPSRRSRGWNAFEVGLNMLGQNQNTIYRIW